jgi:hypothetical protein
MRPEPDQPKGGQSTRQAAAVVLTLGVLAIVVALVLAVVPVRSGGWDCGSVISPGMDAIDERISPIGTRRDCDNALGTRRVIAAFAGIVGIGLTIPGVRGLTGDNATAPDLSAKRFQHRRHDHGHDPEDEST